MSMKVNPALAMNQLRRDVRGMKLPRTMVDKIVEDTISEFDTIGHIHGDFSSIKAEASAKGVLEESEESSRHLMSSVRYNVDDM